ncbi:MAG: cold-shock protein [Nitrospinota bacterium]
MPEGTIKRIIRERGFGFIKASDGREIFFHSTSLQPGAFEGLHEGARVSFEVQATERGPRAVQVRVLEEEA